MDDRELVFQQYRLLTRSLGDTRRRRDGVNAFYVTFSSVLLASAGLSVERLDAAWVGIVISLLGLLVAVAWIVALTAHRRFLDAGEEVLLAIEEQLPVATVAQLNEVRLPKRIRYRHAVLLLPVTIILASLTLAVGATAIALN